MDEKRKKQMIEYTKKNIKQYSFKLNKLFEDDQRMIAWIEQQPNKNEYIRRLIEEDMKKHPGT